MDDNRLSYVTARYPQLRGLELMPLCLLFACMGAYNAGLFSLPGDAAPHVAGRWLMGAFLASLVATYPIRRWYVAHLGIAPQRIAKSQIWPLLAGAGALVLGTAIQPAVPFFNVPVALVALLLGGFGIRDYPFRRHYIAAAAVLLTYALHRLLGVPQYAVRVFSDLSIAAALAIVGLGDHRLLVSTLEPVNSSDQAAHAHV